MSRAAKERMRVSMRLEMPLEPRRGPGCARHDEPEQPAKLPRPAPVLPPKPYQPGPGQPVRPPAPYHPSTPAPPVRPPAPYHPPQPPPTPPEKEREQAM